MDLYLSAVYIASYIGIFVAVFYALSMRANYKKKEIYPLIYKKVSIIIPAYNEEQSIARTIDSAIEIDWPKDKLEVIVIDDGSKDKTFEIAEKYSKYIKVYTKPNGGKGSAINFGLTKASGEIIFTMDADTFVNPDALKKLIPLFHRKEVVAVTPSMAIFRPRTFWQRIQQTEYALGTYLRKAFSTVNVIHVTPGAFSGYRRSFFDKYGGFDEHSLTEDTEIALRIQSHDFIIDNEPNAVIYTMSPETFNELLTQRKRWYTGLLKNLWTYRRMFGFKKGIMGFFSLPLTMVSVITSIFLSSYFIIRTASSLRKEILYLSSINFQFFSLWDFNIYAIKYFIISMFSYKIFLFSLLFLVLVGLYVYYSNKHIPNFKVPVLGVILFTLLYGMLFAFWWAVSIFYTVLNRKVVWRKEKNEL